MGRLSNDPTVVDGNTALTTTKMTTDTATDHSSGTFSGSHHDHDGDTAMDDRAKAARDQILGLLFDEDNDEATNTNIVVSRMEEEDNNLKQAEKQQAKDKHGGAATLYQQQAKLEPKDKTPASPNQRTRRTSADLSASAIELQERVLSLVLSEEFHCGQQGGGDDDDDVDVFDDMDKKTKAKLGKAYKQSGSSSEKKMAAKKKMPPTKDLQMHEAKTAAMTGAKEGKGNVQDAKDEKAAVGIRMEAEDGFAFTPPMPLPHLAEQASSASSARVASESTLPGAVAIRGSHTERLGFGILTSQHNRGNHNTNNSNSNLSYGSHADDDNDDVTFDYNDLETGQGHTGPEQARSGTSGSRDHQVSSSSDSATDEQGLAHAHLVNEEDEQPIANADPVDMNAPRRQRTSSSSQKTAQAQQEQTTQYCLLGIFLCGVVVVATMLGIVFGTDAMSSNRANDTSNSTAVMMTVAPTPDPWALAKELDLADDTLQAIQEDPDQPAAKAYQWLLEDVAAANTSIPAWRQVQRFTLALVYHALGGEAWNANEGWLDHTADECRDWFFRKVIASAPQMGKAVIFVHESETNQTELIESPCDEEGRFTHMAFAGSNLVGAIPQEIALLTSLTYLDVSANSITGSLPTEIALLTNLERLFANRNFISGSIPTEVGLLTNLEMFDVGNNQNFEGPIPSEFGLLSKTLKIFSTQRSSVTGFVPTELFLLTNLEEYLIHQSLNITGGTLEGIGSLSNLREFVAHDIPYKSTIPTELGLLTNLLNFNLWNTQVTGPIPSELWSLTSLRRIDMDDNFLTGPFPSDELGQMSNLQVLFINGNILTGTLPSTPWERMPNISLLSIGGNNGGNQLSGSIPTELGLLTAMTRLGLNMMPLTGTIPSELGRMTGMGTLLLHNTDLTGSIPQDLVAMTALEAFTVSMTHLTGSIPDELCYGIKEVAMKCLSYFGVQGNVCTGFEITDFSCSDSLLCGCSCSNCSST